MSNGCQKNAGIIIYTYNYGNACCDNDYESFLCIDGSTRNDAASVQNDGTGISV